MKKYILFLFVNLFYLSGHTQDIKLDTIDVDRQDILVFNFIEPDILFPDITYETKEIYRDRNIIGLRNRWLGGYGASYINKRFRFTQDSDTMIVVINCSQENNFYFKNMEFKKGNYKIWIADKYDLKTLTKGASISSNIYLNNLFLKNVYRNYNKNSGQYFKLLDFYVIDMQNEGKVKWEVGDDGILFQ